MLTALGTVALGAGALVGCSSTGSTPAPSTVGSAIPLTSSTVTG